MNYIQRARSASARGVWGHAPPWKILDFRPSEVVSEEIFLNELASPYQPLGNSLDIASIYGNNNIIVIAWLAVVHVWDCMKVKPSAIICIKREETTHSSEVNFWGVIYNTLLV